jgi:DNA-binding MurR/RpiR family transcriptional regulator
MNETFDIIPQDRHEPAACQVGHRFAIAEKKGYDQKRGFEMGLVQHETDFKELVVRHSRSLPPQQRVIAEYLLENLESVPFLSVPELAHRIGVSEATVVRFAQRIGYAGFSELKMDLVDMLQGRLAGSDATEPVEVGNDVLGSVAALEITNVRRTVDGLDRASFSAAAESIFAADHVFTFGMGVSAHLAELACYTLIEVGIRATALSTRFSSPREQLVPARSTDLLLVLSFPPYSRQTLDMLSEAAERNMVTVALCDRLTAPASTLASHVLPVKSDNMMFTNAVAAVTIMINALATEIATAHQGRAIEALSQINRILTDDADIIAPDR